MKKFFILLLVELAVISMALGGAWYVSTYAEPRLGTSAVMRGNVIASLDLPGKVSSDNSVDISFQESGKITAVNVKEGDRVTSGEVLATLDDSNLQAGLSQSQAALAGAQANYEKVLEGSSDSQIAVAQRSVDSAQVTLQDAETNLASVTAQQKTAVQNAYTTLLNTSITAVPSTGNPDAVTPLVTGTFTGAAGGSYTISVSPGFGAPRFTVSGLEQAVGNVSVQPTALGKDGLFVQFSSNPNVDDMWTITIPNTAVPSYVVNQNAYQSALSNQSAQVSTAQSQVNAAQAALAQTQANLAMTVSKATSADIDSAKAAVLQAQAGVENANLLIAHSKIVAPFSGIARNVTAKSGMVVSSGATVLSIINSGAMKFDAYASETDEPKVQNGAAASIALDAFGGGVTFPAKVEAIDTAETIVNGSPAYHVTLYFTEPNNQISAGMTGNVGIVTAEHDGVIEIPARLVLNNAGTPSVLVRMNGQNILKPVTLGLMGDNGMIEIVSGLAVGDELSDF